MLSCLFFVCVRRKILDNVRGEREREHWIILDGDVDPNWVENLSVASVRCSSARQQPLTVNTTSIAVDPKLTCVSAVFLFAFTFVRNSVLDDNKLLTLPNGERLALTPNIRIIFEVQNLNFATPATVSRCGIILFTKEVVTTPMIMLQMLRQIKAETLNLVNVASSVYARWKPTQVRCVEILEPLFGLHAGAMTGSELPSSLESVASCFVLGALNWVEEHCSHIMTFSRTQGLVSLFSMMKGGISRVIEHNDAHADFPMSDRAIEAYLSKYLVYSVLWAFGGSLSLKERLRYCAELINLVPSSIAMPDTKNKALIDYEVRIDTGDWSPYDDRVDSIELDSQKVSDCFTHTHTHTHTHTLLSLPLICS